MPVPGQRGEGAPAQAPGSGLLAGKVAAVVGASRGIGRAAAILFADEGAAVAVGSRDGRACEDVARQIRDNGGRAAAITLDVSSSSSVGEFIRDTVALFGRLDCAFNNAAVEGRSQPIADSDDEDWNDVIAVDATGTYYCVRAQVRQFLAQGSGGSIVNTSSLGGIVGLKGKVSYIAAKHAVSGITRSVAMDYGPAGIRVNAICPGATLTGMMERVWAGAGAEALAERIRSTVPLQRMADPREIAEAALWLLSDRASYVSGQVIAIDGGREAG